MQVIIVMGYFALGLFQLAATIAGFEEWLGLHWVLAAFISFFIAYMPLIGTVVGIYGAMTAWEWSLFQAGGLFLGPFLVLITLGVLGGIIGEAR